MKPSISRFGLSSSSVLFALALSACGLGATEGERPRQICKDTFTVVPVRVQDAMGQPVPDAQVIARNVTSGKVLTAMTGGDGRTSAVTEEIGNGQIQVTATAGALATRQSFIVQMVCGECDCTAMPGTVSLTLQ